MDISEQQQFQVVMQDDAGEGDFEYDVPAGYYAICTNNLGDQS